MKTILLNFITTIILAFVLTLFLPWWAIAIAGIISGFIFSLKKFAVFFVPFLAVLVLWVVQTYLLSSANDFILAKRIATLFPLSGNPYLLIFVTGIIGGIVAGFGGILGKQFKAVMIK